LRAAQAVLAEGARGAKGGVIWGCAAAISVHSLAPLAGALHNNRLLHKKSGGCTKN